jgi:hypothetical protein
MSRHQPAFKNTQIFDWDAEPSDERPTDFGRSTGFSTLSSGYHILGDASHASRHRRRENRRGFARLAVIATFLLGACTVVIMEMANHLR